MFKKTKVNTVMFVGIRDNDAGQLVSTLPGDFDILNVSSGDESVALLEKQERLNREKIRLIICDQNQRGMAGTEFLHRSISLIPRAKRVLLIDYPQLDMEALNRAQLFRFITKPYALESLISTIRMALEEMGKETRPLLCDHAMVGQDPGFLEALDLVRRVSDSKAPVLVRGETGTGKELIARALHCNGSEAGKPYVVVNCSAMPETLFEAEMFGHKKGAFTGAHQDRKGRVAMAEGGTIFIDELAEIPLQVQAKLLRFIQFGEFQRVGSDRVEKANVRIVAATNQDLEKKIEEGSFREDLYYRLKVIEVTVPPLRERRSDIRLLADAFIKKYWSRPGTPTINSHALKMLRGYSFPGNVRELENVIQRACLLARTDEIGLDVLPVEIIEKVWTNKSTNPILSSPAHTTFTRLDKEALKRARIEASTQAGNRVEREFLKQLMARFDTVTGAAAHAGMQRTYLHSLLAKHGLNHSK